jgi:hypothetical protein
VLDGAQGGRSGGLLLGAGFGAGKSHVLTHLSAVALERGFAVSTVVVSKETPLYDPAKVLRAAVDTLTGPGRIGGVLTDAVAGLDPDSAGYAELRRWVGSTPADSTSGSPRRCSCTSGCRATTRRRRTSSSPPRSASGGRAASPG